MAGHFSLCPEEGWDASRFRYFVPEYTKRDTCHWESAVPTSALLLTHPARTLSPGAQFPIHANAAVYSAILVALIAVWPPLLIFTDLANTAYFNSFYLDGFALLALLALAIAARNLLRPVSNGAIMFYTIAAVFLITSKLQHSTLAVPLAAFLLAQAKWRALFPATVLLFCAVYMQLATPQLATYWETRLGEEMSYPKLAVYYGKHPALAWERFVASARGLKHVRPDYLGNTPLGTPPFMQSHRADSFSAAKSYLFNAAPYLAIAIYVGLAWWIPRPLALLLFAMAALEFLTSTFADSVLDYRHHALLHQLLDVWLLYALVGTWREAPRK